MAQMRDNARDLKELAGRLDEYEQDLRLVSKPSLTLAAFKSLARKHGMGGVAAMKKKANMGAERETLKRHINAELLSDAHAVQRLRDEAAAAGQARLTAREIKQRALRAQIRTGSRPVMWICMCKPMQVLPEPRCSEIRFGQLLRGMQQQQEQEQSFQHLCPLALLPCHLLDRLLHLPGTDPGSSSIRRTCRWLRRAFDRSNPCLVLKAALAKAELGPGQNKSQIWSRLRNLVRRSPCISSLTLAPGFTALSWTEVMEACGARLQQRLQCLDLSGRNDVAGLRPLAACTALQYLSLARCAGIGHLEPLAACTALQRLCLERCQAIEQLSPLAACSRLQCLDLSGCQNVVSIIPLAACSALQRLNLKGCTGITQLKPLAACAALQLLSLEGCTGIWQLEPLAACTALQLLVLAGCTGITELEPLAACTALSHLSLRFCTGVECLAPLSACTALHRLDLSGCTRVGNLTPLSACTALHRLDLSGCTRVGNLTPLSACTALQHLGLSGHWPARALRPLAALPHLHIVNPDQVSVCMVVMFIIATAAGCLLVIALALRYGYYSA